jgi:hypothetical protein
MIFFRSDRTLFFNGCKDPEGCGSRKMTNRYICRFCLSAPLPGWTLGCPKIVTPSIFRSTTTYVGSKALARFLAIWLVVCVNVCIETYSQESGKDSGEQFNRLTVSPEPPQSPLQSADDNPSDNSQPPVEPTFGRLQELLRRLESQEFQIRAQTEREIIQMGPSVIPLLPSITPQTSGELRLRLERIRRSLESQIREQFFQASRLTLQSNESLSTLLNEIHSQTNNRIRIQSEEVGLNQSLLVVDWHETPFWTAVGEILDRAQLRLVPFSGNANELVLDRRVSLQPVRPCVSEAFRVDISSILCERNFDSRLESQMRIGLILSWEPRLEPLFMHLPMSSFNAEDDQGSVVGATNSQAAPEIRLNIGGCSVQFEIQMNCPRREARLLRSFSGSFLIAVPGDRHEYVFENLDLGRRQVQQFGDLSVTLESAKINGPVFETRLFVQFGDPVGALDSFRGWIMSNRAVLIDSAGNVIENVGLQTYAASSNGVGVSYLFKITEQTSQYRLIYESPSSVVNQLIEFQLPDIPLP